MTSRRPPCGYSHPSVTPPVVPEFTLFRGWVHQIPAARPFFGAFANRLARIGLCLRPGLFENNVRLHESYVEPKKENFRCPGFAQKLFDVLRYRPCLLPCLPHSIRFAPLLAMTTISISQAT